MVLQERLALEVKKLPDEQASLVAAHIEKLKKRSLARDEKKRFGEAMKGIPEFTKT